MFDLKAIIEEAESLITTFPQREALLRKAAGYFEQGTTLLAQAGYDPKAFALLNEAVGIPESNPQTPDVPVDANSPEQVDLTPKSTL